MENLSQDFQGLNSYLNKYSLHRVYASAKLPLYVHVIMTLDQLQHQQHQKMLALGPLMLLLGCLPKVSQNYRTILHQHQRTVPQAQDKTKNA